jgi:hypothetical protein
LNDFLHKWHHIVFHWEYFLPAILLLCLPLPLPTGRWTVSVSDRQYHHHGLGGFLLAWQNWADLLRSVVGAWTLWHLSLTVGTKADGVPMMAFLIKTAVLSLSVLMQMIRFGDELNFFPPICFLSGLTIVLPGSMEGGLACGFGWAFAAGARNAKFQLPVMGVSLAIVAPLLGNHGQNFLLNCGLIFGSLLVPILCRKRILFVSRGIKGSAEAAILFESDPETKEGQRPEPEAVLKSRPSPSN